jgi:hypothetical protein
MWLDLEGYFYIQGKNYCQKEEGPLLDSWNL